MSTQYGISETLTQVLDRYSTRSREVGGDVCILLRGEDYGRCSDVGMYG